MPSLTGIVRPFQLPEDAPAAPAPTSKDKPTVTNTVIKAGENGGAKTFSASFNLDITYYNIHKPKEKAKT